MIVPPLLPLTPIQFPGIEAFEAISLILVSLIVCLVDIFAVPRLPKKELSNAKPKDSPDH